MGVLGVAASIPGKHTVYLRDDGRTKGIVKREHIVRPLIESQPYIAACKVWKDEPIEWESEKFRNGYHSTTNTLLFAHARHARDNGVITEIPTGEFAWLKVDPDKGMSERVVINRSPRYQNDMFPWDVVAQKYGKALLFVGLPEEHYWFEERFGKVEYRPTKDMLEVAKLIAGSFLFIGNQSSAMTLAEGLKKRRLQETCLTVPDCIYPGDSGAQYVAEGSSVLPGLDGVDTITSSRALRIEEVSTIFVPKGGWQYDSPETGPLMTSHIDTCARDVHAKLKSSITREQARDMVLRYNIQRSPRSFMPSLSVSRFAFVQQALQSANITKHPVLDLFSGNVNFNL